MPSVVVELKSLRAAKKFVEWFEELDDEHDVMRELSAATGVDCTAIDITIEGVGESSEDFLFSDSEDGDDWEDEDELDQELRRRGGVRGNDWIL